VQVLAESDHGDDQRGSEDESADQADGQQQLPGQTEQPQHDPRRRGGRIHRRLPMACSECRVRPVRLKDEFVAVDNFRQFRRE
jgi:hypothetical protein